MRIVNVGCTLCPEDSEISYQEGINLYARPNIDLENIKKACEDRILIMDKHPNFREFTSPRNEPIPLYGRHCFKIPVQMTSSTIQNHLENFISAIRDGTKLRDPIEQASKNLIALEAAVRSAREMRTIDLV